MYRICFFFVFIFIEANRLGYAQTTNSHSDVDSKPLSVLFIGNSFTFMNKMPTLFQKIAEADKQAVFVDKWTHGGANLQYHSSNPETYGKIKSHPWDYVVIQGFSREFAKPIDSVENTTKGYLERLIDSISIYRKETKILLYMTWGYKDGFTQREATDSYSKMQKLITDNSERIANELHIGISPVGITWKYVREMYPTIELYYTDGAHPSLAGSYLVASVFYAQIMGKNPEGNKSDVTLPPEEKQQIERAANNAVHHLQEVLRPEKLPSTDSNPHLHPGFDVVVTKKNIFIFDRSHGAESVHYKVEPKGKIFSQVRNAVIPRTKRMKELEITQEVYQGKNTKTVTRKIKLE